MPDLATISNLLLWHLLASAAGFVLAMLLFARVLREHSMPTTSIAWLLAIVLVPYLGVPAYLVFGSRKLRELTRRKPALNAPPMRTSPVTPGLPLDAARLLASHDMPPARTGNRIEFIGNGEQAWHQLTALLRGARVSIDIQTFILTDDPTGRAIVELLCRKAREGVRVRVLLDALGSLYARLRLTRRLRQAGVEVGIFMPMLPFRRRWSANLRNHRKLILIDRRWALTGGMNLAEEYLGESRSHKRWIDTALLIEGPLVQDMAQLLADDWSFATGQPSATEPPQPMPMAGGDVAQLVASGPDVHGDPLYDLIMSLLYRARHRIWIATPYLLPDEGLTRALRLQARLGVDVRLILPRHSNHPTADMARNRILRELALDGVRIFMHPQRMIHAKHLLIDDELAIAGSANLDMRSLHYNFEVAVCCYSVPAIAATADWLRELLHDCAEGQVPPRTFLRQWLEDICWLLTPLL